MSEIVDDRPAVKAADVSSRLSRGGLSWALYEGVRTPYVTLIKVYIFVPYFATVLVGNPVQGQALVGQLSMAFSMAAAFTAPFLGAAMDRIGPRKPFLGVVTAAMVVLIASLWWATPQGGLGVPVICAILFVMGLLFAYSEVLHNALLVHAASRQETSTASGLGLAMGNGLSVLLLIAVLWAFALPGKLDLPFLPDAPLFGLSTALHEPERIVAPIVAVLFALGAIPLFLFARDAPRGEGGGVGASLRQLGQTLAGLKQDRRMALFLGSRMIYNDGMTTILLFSGVYAAGVMQWGVVDLLAFAVILSIFLSLGGLLATRLDNAFGAKRAIQIELMLVLACQVLILGVAPDRLFYLPYAGDPVWNSPVFDSLPELVFLALGCVNALGVCASYASSRVMLTRLSAPDRLAGWFGLYALSGSVTMWLGAALIGLATTVFATQQAGFVPILGLLLIGLIGLSFVKADGRV